MKKLKPLISITMTLMISCIIIFAGYRILAIAGNHFILSDSSVKAYPMEQDDAYVFYSQADSDITFYPWNYYENAVSIRKWYEDGKADENVIIDVGGMYYRVADYLYKTMPASVQEKMRASDIDFLTDVFAMDSMFNQLKIASFSNSYYYFFEGDIVICGEKFHLTFCFDEFDNLCSFQCRLLEEESSISEEEANAGNECLKELLNDKEHDNLVILLADMFFEQSYLYDYSVVKDVNGNYGGLNFSKEGQILESEYDMSEGKYYSSYYSSYQIMQTKEELLLILVDNSLVLHFDPVHWNFTGFHILER